MGGVFRFVALGTVIEIELRFFCRLGVGVLLERFLQLGVFDFQCFIFCFKFTYPLAQTSILVFKFGETFFKTFDFAEKEDGIHDKQRITILDLSCKTNWRK